MESTGFTTNLNLWPYRHLSLSLSLSVSTYTRTGSTNVGVEQGRVIWTWPQGSTTWLDLLGMKKNERKKRQKKVCRPRLLHLSSTNTPGDPVLFLRSKNLFFFSFYSKTLSPPPTRLPSQHEKKVKSVCVWLLPSPCSPPFYNLSSFFFFRLFFFFFF